MDHVDTREKRQRVVTTFALVAALVCIGIVGASLHHNMPIMPVELAYDVGPIAITVALLALIGSRKVKTRNIVYLAFGTASVVIGTLLLAKSQMRSSLILGACGIFFLIIGVWRKEH
jgi:hypothetical protein